MQVLIFYQTNIQFCHIVFDTDLQTDDTRFLPFMNICERNFFQAPSLFIEIKLYKSDSFGQIEKRIENMCPVVSYKP